MKQCPTCNRTYHDGTQSFCLEDGARLVTAYDGEATQVMSPPYARAAVSQRPPAVVTSAPRNANPALYIGIALAALLVGGILVALFRSGTTNITTAQPGASSSPNPANTATPMAAAKRNSEPPATPIPMNRVAPSTSVPPSASGTWFVVLGSFPKNQYERANQRLQSIQAAGYAGNIIDTDRYPGLKGGLWAVVMGPYSKADARALALQMKSVRADAYAKAGW